MNKASCSHSPSALSSGKLIWKESGPVYKAQLIQHGIGFLLIRSPASAQSLCKQQILPKGKRLNKIGILKKKTDLLCPYIRLFIVGKTGGILAIEGIAPPVFFKQQPHYRKQGTFACARDPFHGYKISAVYAHIDVLKRAYRFAHAVFFFYMFKPAYFHISLYPPALLQSAAPAQRSCMQVLLPQKSLTHRPAAVRQGSTVLRYLRPTARL